MDIENLFKVQSEILTSLYDSINIQSEILKAIKAAPKRQEIVVLNSRIIPAGDSVGLIDISNAGFTKCRIFVDALFTSGHTGGLILKLIYKNNPIADILQIISSNGSSGAASLPFDISELSNFSIEIRNIDSSNDTKVTGLKCILYHGGN